MRPLTLYIQQSLACGWKAVGLWNLKSESRMLDECHSCLWSQVGCGWNARMMSNDWWEGSRWEQHESEVTQSCRILCDPMDCSLNSGQAPPPWDFPGKNTGVGCHFLLQEIFLTQGLNPGFPHCRQTLYHLSHQGSLNSLKLKGGGDFACECLIDVQGEDCKRPSLPPRHRIGL